VSVSGSGRRPKSLPAIPARYLIAAGLATKQFLMLIDPGSAASHPAMRDLKATLAAFMQRAGGGAIVG
jgi:hypothetical protein